METKHFVVGLLFSCMIFVFSNSAYAGFANIVAFGDSSTDDGNADGHGNGRYTNGLIWVERLAEAQGASLYDYAYGGARTGFEFPDINWQVAQSDIVANIEQLDKLDTLFTVWAGVNDFSLGDYANSVGNVRIALETLVSYGAKNILVPNLPDLGNSPVNLGNSELSAFSIAFNTELSLQLADFQNLNESVNLYTIDVFSMVNDGFISGSPEWLELFWEVDNLHPSDTCHELIFQAANDALNCVPLPSALWLLGSGIMGLIGLRRKIRKP